MSEVDKSDTHGTVRIVLVGTTHPGNIGAAARAMKTMGFAELVLVSPARFPAAEASARAAGADDILARARVVEDLSDAVGDCALVLATSARPRHIEWPELTPREAASASLAALPGGAVALVFGRENSGLSNTELDLCQALVRIPTAPDYASLNLAAAVQVLTYELAMARVENELPDADVSPAHEAVSQREMEGFYQHLEHALTDIGYFDPQAPKLLRRRLRRIFNRVRPDRSELNILRGILGAAQKAAGKQPD